MQMGYLLPYAWMTMTTKVSLLYIILIYLPIYLLEIDNYEDDEDEDDEDGEIALLEHGTSALGSYLLTHLLT